MHLHVINPNTDDAMTALIGEAARGAASPGTRITVSHPDMGPASIESHYDEALAAPGVLVEIDRAQQAGADGFVIACFGDPALLAAREIAVGPVVGIAEGAMHAATLLGRGFSVVTSLQRTAGRAWDLASEYGFRERCLAVRAVEIDVLAIGDPASHAYERLHDESIAARDEDGADAIVLGCAGLADLCRRLTDDIGIPVVDGVAASVALVEGLVRLGLHGSARDEFAPPPPKPYLGLLAGFERPRPSSSSSSSSV
jgi:allantoin racemase